VFGVLKINLERSKFQELYGGCAKKKKKNMGDTTVILSILKSKRGFLEVLQMQKAESGTAKTSAYFHIE
jgi:hypothetical protein